MAQENKETFQRAGGGEYRYIPALNDSHEHIEALMDIISTNLQGWPEGNSVWSETIKNKLTEYEALTAGITPFYQHFIYCTHKKTPQFIKNHGVFTFKAWQWPTLTWEPPHYHRRWAVSLPSSRWDRVVHARYGRQAKLLQSRKLLSPGSSSIEPVTYPLLHVFNYAY